jgi:hypothetical protein
MKLSQEQYSFFADFFRRVGSSIFFALMIVSVLAEDKINLKKIIVSLFLAFFFWYLGLRAAGNVKDDND